MNEILEDLQFLIERLGLNDEQIEETLNITRELGVRPEYFSDEFIFLQEEDLRKMASYMTQSI